MRENFEAALARVLKHEGGYSNHPRDPGGATMRGVTQRVYDAWRAQHKLFPQSVRHISESELRAIYALQYWDKVRGNELPAGLDYCVFDAAVNSGPVRAVKWLQQALGVRADGVFGLVTLRAVAACDAAATIRRFAQARRGFLRMLPTWAVFGRGWQRRVTEVERDALGDAKAVA